MSARREDRDMSEGSSYGDGGDTGAGGTGGDNGGTGVGEPPVHPDQEQVNAQVDALLRLQNFEDKRQTEDWIIDRRRVGDERPEPGFRRVRLERVRRLTRENELTDDDIITVSREIIAPVPDSVADEDQRERLREQLENFHLVERLCCDLARYEIPDTDDTVATALQRLRADGATVSANHLAALGNTSKGGDTPADTTREPRLLASEAGEPSTGAPLVVVIDTGLDIDVQARTDAFLDDIVAGPHDRDRKNEVTDATGQPPADDFLDRAAGHGTFVAGIIRQVEPEARVVMLRALDTEGMGGEDMIATAICWSRTIFEQHGGRGVLNLSLGIETIDDLPPLAIECALRELPPGVVVVAAAGNEPSRRPLWPAAHKRVLAVGGLCDDLSPSAWSNRGGFVDFSTRGEGIVSTFVEGNEAERDGDPPASFFGQTAYATWTGTSFSAPQVAAQIAGLIANLGPDDPVEIAVQQLRQAGTYTPDWGYVLDILPPANPPLVCSRERLRAEA